MLSRSKMVENKSDKRSLKVTAQNTDADDRSKPELVTRECPDHTSSWILPVVRARRFEAISCLDATATGYQPMLKFT